jgi:hypothetical protein
VRAIETLIGERRSTFQIEWAHREAPYLPHQAEQIVVAPKEHMQPHLNVVPVFILEAGHFASNEWPAFIEINLSTRE